MNEDERDLGILGNDKEKLIFSSDESLAKNIKFEYSYGFTKIVTNNRYSLTIYEFKME